MNKKTGAIFFGCVLLGIAAQAMEIRGTVVSPVQNPVQGAVVLHRPTGVKTETDAAGNFVLDVAEAFLLPGWKVFGNVAAIRGRSLETGVPLNDIPPVQIYTGTRVWKGKLSAELNATFRLAKSNPGPAEIDVASSELVNLKATYLWRGLNFYVTLGNIFNAAYVARADSEAMVEPGRNLRLGFVYSF